MEKDILKKRVLVVFILICISYITYGIINIRKVPNQVATTNALPITSKVVVIDAGHGLPDERSGRF